MNTEKIKLTQVSTNEKNPRRITDGNLKKLINSILVFPRMLELRPIVIDDAMIPLGGNMRIKALTHIAAMSIEQIKSQLQTVYDFTKIAKKSPDKTVYWNDVCKDIEGLVSQFQWGRADGFNCNSSEKRAKFDGMTMADYMRYLWNNPQNGQSPYKLFEGALIPAGKDLNGNLIYKYNGATF